MATPLLSIFLILIAATIIYAHNITEILSSNPNFSIFNDYLSQTKLSDEINSRQPITVLALNNTVIPSLTADRSLSVIKSLISVHLLLDYFDPPKLHSFQNRFIQSTTLYQTTGTAIDNSGFVNITALKGGAVEFGSCQPGSKLNSTYVNSIKQFPYTISVIEISAPIIPPAITAAQVNPTVNMTAVLEKAGCKNFAALLSQSGVAKTFESQMAKGLTVFSPADGAFKAKGVPDFSKLSNAEIISLLQYHALESYTPIGSLKITKGSLSTLASTGAGKFEITVTADGDAVTINTGVDSSKVVSTLVDLTPVVVYSVDSVLLPVEIFSCSPPPKQASPPPAEVPGSSPAVAPSNPAVESPVDSPADSPASDEDKSGVGNVRVDVVVVVVAVAVSVTFSVISLIF